MEIKINVILKMNVNKQDYLLIFFNFFQLELVIVYYSYSYIFESLPLFYSKSFIR